MDLYTLVTEYGSKVLAHETVQFGLAFTLAAFVHAKQVRKEMALQMGGIALSIDDLGRALREDLKAQNVRLGNIETRVKQLENKES